MSNKTYDSVRRRMKKGTLILLTVVNTFLSSVPALAAEDRHIFSNFIDKLEALQNEYSQKYELMDDERRKEYQDLAASAVEKFFLEVKDKLKNHLDNNEFENAKKLYDAVVLDCEKLKIDYTQLLPWGYKINRLIELDQEKKKQTIEENENYKGYVQEIAPVLANKATGRRFIFRTINNDLYLIAKGEGKTDNKANAFANGNYEWGVEEAAKRHLEPSGKPNKLRIVNGKLTQTILVSKLREK